MAKQCDCSPAGRGGQIKKSKEVKAAWPSDWVNGVDYPHKNQCANVTDQLVLNDPQAASTKFPHLTIGLSHPDHTGGGGASAQRSGNGKLELNEDSKPASVSLMP